MTLEFHHRTFKNDDGIRSRVTYLRTSDNQINVDLSDEKDRIVAAQEHEITRRVVADVLNDERGLKWLIDDLNALIRSGYLRSPEYFHLEAIIQRLKLESIR